MRSESELREAMRSSANIATTGIDTETVVRRARARRVPKQVAFSSLSVLAVVGVAALGITTLPSLQSGQVADSTSEMMTSAQEPGLGDSTGDSASRLSDARLVPSNLCGRPTIITVPDSTGLSLSMEFPESVPASGHSVNGTVALTNSGTTHVSGTTALEPVITVSQDGITVWHSNPVLHSRAAPIDLGPGQSYSYDAHFTPVGCEPADDEGERFRDDLAALDAGWYEISAEILFVSDSAEPGAGILVGGAVQRIELR